MSGLQLSISVPAINFYGNDPLLERAIQEIEGAYGAALSEMLRSRYTLTEAHRRLLRRFWLLQHLRTEAASRRAVEMMNVTRSAVGLDASSFRLEIREAVRMAMKTFAESMHVVDDLKVCLVRNRTSVPFVASDDPAVLTNRWYVERVNTGVLSFGLFSAGDILLLPLSPRMLCLGYDGDVYNVPHENGVTEVRRTGDIEALNEHQFLNCRANIFVQDSVHSPLVHESFLRAAPSRPAERHVVRYAVLDSHDGEFARYRVINPADAGEHKEALIHTQVVHVRPTGWPRLISWRSNGFAFTNGTGVGFVRRASTDRESIPPFRKEPTHRN